MSTQNCLDLGSTKQISLWFMSQHCQNVKMSWFRSGIHPFSTSTKTMRNLFSPSLFLAADWRHKRQRAWVEIRTIYRRHRLHKKKNANSSTTNDRGYKRGENNSHRNTLDNTYWTALLASLLNRNGTPPPWNRFPTPCSQQWYKVL